MRWLHGRSGPERLDKNFVTVEMIACFAGVCISTYLTVRYTGYDLFIVPVIVAWIEMFAVPMFWAHMFHGSLGLFSLTIGALFVAVGTALSTAPMLEYDLEGGKMAGLIPPLLQCVHL